MKKKSRHGKPNQEQRGEGGKGNSSEISKMERKKEGPVVVSFGVENVQSHPGEKEGIAYSLSLRYAQRVSGVMERWLGICPRLGMDDRHLDD